MATPVSAPPPPPPAILLEVRKPRLLSDLGGAGQLVAEPGLQLHLSTTDGELLATRQLAGRASGVGAPASPLTVPSTPGPEGKDTVGHNGPP